MKKDTESRDICTDLSNFAIQFCLRFLHSDEQQNRGAPRFKNKTKHLKTRDIENENNIEKKNIIELIQKLFRSGILDGIHIQSNRPVMGFSHGSRNFVDLCKANTEGIVD